MVYSHVPFADHNAMLDPSTSDITARTLEMLSYFGYDGNHPTVKRALKFLKKDQCADRSWYGRWGVNYIYGTWQVLKGLRLIGVDMSEDYCKKGADWLKSIQNPDGGWGETCLSYDDPTQKGKGPSTASQTAWSLMGLISATEENSAEVKQGIDYLLHTQNLDGTWTEDWYTGTGFPRVFYLLYHMYRQYFPMIALTTYGKVMAEAQGSS